ncbi:MAG: HAD-IA family hydrolase [Magnetococcales bacterium]|nr:HAD-IA family hydrolase [Magnetococcales bacterium]
MSGFSAVIFDMDGVLWHSDKAHAQAYEAVFNSLGLPSYDYQALAGRRTNEVMASILKSAGMAVSTEIIAELTAKKQAKAREILRLNPPIAPDCQEVLQYMANSYNLALASSASAGSVEVFLQNCGARNSFSAVLNGEDVKKAKPAPDIFLLALEQLKTLAHKAVVVEDSISGITAARAADIQVIALLPKSLQKPIHHEQSMAVVENLSQLKEIL